MAHDIPRRRLRRCVLLLLLIVLGLAACAQLQPTPVPTPLPSPTPSPPPTSIPTPALPDVTSEIQQAVAYLQAEYNPEIGLIRESPEAAPNVYWLATDNYLAAMALGPYDAALAEDLTSAIQAYGGVEHGLIEALAGESIDWPPHTEHQLMVGSDVACPKKPETATVCVERRDGEEDFADWTEYSDFALYHALKAYNRGDTEAARARYRQALARLEHNNIGFQDKAWREGWNEGERRYATYKLALALYVGVEIGEKPPDALLAALLAKQDKSGGFTTLYDESGAPKGDPNTETTSYALLALHKLQTGR